MELQILMAGEAATFVHHDRSAALQPSGDRLAAAALARHETGGDETEAASLVHAAWLAAPELLETTASGNKSSVLPKRFWPGISLMVTTFVRCVLEGVDYCTGSSKVRFTLPMPQLLLRPPRAGDGGVGVAEGYRRQGIGRRLLQAAETWSISRGARAAGFSTYIGAPGTVAFYERTMGYARQAVYLQKSLA
jgi:GNAT superfamily N-acetyltransferase